MTEHARANVGVTGLATMGRNLARNLAGRRGNVVAVHNRTRSKVHDLVERFGDEGDFVACESIEEFVNALTPPRVAIVMVAAGPGTDAVIEQLVDAMDEGDIVVDGGNADFHDTIEREESLKDRGIHFVGTGISGGEEGALHGPSIMPGGSAEAYETLGPILESIAARADDGEPCVTHLGTDGAGHFVKMVHNGIEYADMQLIAESFDLLRRVGGLSPAEIADVVEGWNDGDLSSYLIEIAAEVLRHVDAESGEPFVDVVVDRAGQKGTGTWTVQNALDLGVPVSGIAEAVFARAVSSHPEQREAVAALGHDRPSPVEVDDSFADDVRDALYAAKVVAYAQGFDEIAAGAERYDWDIDKAAVARIWRAGCIIRAALLDRIADAYDGDPALPTLLVDPFFADAVRRGEAAWRRVVSTAALSGVPAPAFAATLAHHDALRSERLPASLIQGLRDFFGAHTYERVDREGTFHTAWAEDGRPEREVDD